MRYIMDLLRRWSTRGIGAVECRQDVHDEYNAASTQAHEQDGLDPPRHGRPTTATPRAGRGPDAVEQHGVLADDARGRPRRLPRRAGGGDVRGGLMIVQEPPGALPLGADHDRRAAGANSRATWRPRRAGLRRRARTWAQARDDARAFAKALLAAGIGRGDHVAVGSRTGSSGSSCGSPPHTSAPWSSHQHALQDRGGRLHPAPVRRAAALHG